MCSKRGFRDALPGYVYVVSAVLDGQCVIQFGISTFLEKRLRQHRQSGFTEEPLMTRFFEEGRDARELERQLLRLMSAEGVPSASNDGVVFSGSTEAFLLSSATEEFLEQFCVLTGVSRGALG